MSKKKKSKNKGKNKVIKLSRIQREFGIGKKEELLKTIKKLTGKEYKKQATITSKKIYYKLRDYYKEQGIDVYDRNEKGQFITGKPHDTNKNGNAGRPSVMTEKVLKKLRDGFAHSFTDMEACLYAGISHQTLYNYCKEHPEFFELKKQLKKKPNLKAKMNWIKKIKNGDYTASKEWLERKSSEEFSKQINQVSAELSVEEEEDEGVNKILEQLGLTNDEDNEDGGKKQDG